MQESSSGPLSNNGQFYVDLQSGGSSGEASGSLDAQRLSADQLMDALLSIDFDDQDVEEILAEAIRRSSPTIFDRAKVMLAHSSPRVRQSAAEIMGNFGLEQLSSQDTMPTSAQVHNVSYLERTRRQAVSYMVERLNSEPDPEVLASIVAGLGRNGVSGLVEQVVGYATSESPRLREAVAFALPTMMSNVQLNTSADELDETYEMVKNTLVELAGDPYEPVREWALFALAEMLDPAMGDKDVIDCLFGHLDESNLEIRAECAYGLAIRGVRDSLACVESLLGGQLDDRSQRIMVEAASALGHPSLIRSLERLYDQTDQDQGDALGPSRELIGQALERCRQASTI